LSPRSSPPFPYTTLFRSIGETAPPHRARAAGTAALDRPVRHGWTRSRHAPIFGVAGVGGNACVPGARRRNPRSDEFAPPPSQSEDRKSTRLNSSHVKISY